MEIINFSIADGQPEAQSAHCLVLAVFEGAILSPELEHLDQIADGFFTKVLSTQDFSGKVGASLMLYQAPHIKAERVLLIGCGKADELSHHKYSKISTAVVKALKETHIEEVFSYLTDLNIPHRDLVWKIEQGVQVTSHALYQFLDYKTKEATPHPLKNMIFHVAHHALGSAELALKRGIAVARGVQWARDLANTPANVCTPSYLAEQARHLAKHHKKISVNVLDESKMKKLGMGALLAVAQGSDEPPFVALVEYRGTQDDVPPIALVGKGITFDTGGIQLKSSQGILGMKFDMCGAATVLAVMQVIAELDLPLHVVGALATAENMPSGKATRPDDVIRTMQGLTVEIGNTDAEGRLVLCDTLTYVQQEYKPRILIDIATLTGACVVALGRHASGLLSNNEPLAQALLKAGEMSADRVWQLPLWEDYQSQLDSPIADLNNVGGSEAGTVTAACFLSRFTKESHWAHLDVAGTAHRSEKEVQATGRPVPLLCEYLFQQIL